MPPRGRSNAATASGEGRTDGPQNEPQNEPEHGQNQPEGLPSGAARRGSGADEGAAVELGARAGGGGPASAGGGIRLPLPANLPGGLDAKRLLWFGGLGALAVIGILDWPVAVVVGAGTVVAGQLARDSAKQAAGAARVRAGAEVTGGPGAGGQGGQTS
jgi:hypothetical protein